MNPNLIYLAGGIIIPLIVSLISSPKWPGGVRAALAFTLCVGLAFWQSRGHFGPDIIENFLKIFVAVQGLYLGLLKQIGLPELERGSAEAWTKLMTRIAEAFSRPEAVQWETDSTPPTAPMQSTTARLLEAKSLLDAGAITTDEFAKIKAEILGGTS